MKEEGFFSKIENAFEGFMFWSRWVQGPLYTGLIIASFLYLVKFFQELYHVWHHLLEYDDNRMMLGVLNLVDISMVMNLVVMVTIGGYSIFTSKINLDMHEDKPLWLEDLDAGQLKIKLATSLASISGVQLLKTFINYREAELKAGAEGIIIEIIIHMVFIISALLLSQTEKITHSYKHGNHAMNTPPPKKPAPAPQHRRPGQPGAPGTHSPTPHNPTH